MNDTLEPEIYQTILVAHAGEVSKDNKSFSGQCSVSFDNGTAYRGQFLNGLFDGKGAFEWPDGVAFEGDFVKSVIVGEGIFHWPDDSQYTGEVVNGLRHGAGTLLLSTGQSYEGDWKFGLRDGFGTMYYDADRTIVYKGGWLAGKRHGHGVMTYGSGNIYEGEWADDMKCGRGMMQWKTNSEVYVGDWRDDLPDGEGEHIWIETPGAGKTFQRQMCNIYRGSMRRGVRCGVGNFFYANGAQYAGEWADNCKHGLGVYVSADGAMSYGEYAYDRIVQVVDTAGAKPLRETEAVAPQFRLNIEDISLWYPRLGDASHDAVSEVERLLLRYNSSVRTLLKKYIQCSRVYAAKNKVTAPASLPPHEARYFTARNLHERIFCMSILQVVQCAREMDLISGHLSAHDVAVCVAEMRQQHQIVAKQLQEKYHSLYRDKDAPVIELLDIVNAADQPDTPMPIRDREFVELLVRIICLHSCRAGVKGGLVDVVYHSLADIIQPLAAETISPPPVVAALYSDVTQAVIRRYQTQLRALWTKLTDIPGEESKGSTVELRSTMKYFMSLKGSVLSQELCTPFSLLEACGRLGSLADFSTLNQPINIDDFIELLCRLIGSSLWASDSSLLSIQPSYAVSVDRSDVPMSRQASPFPSGASGLEGSISTRLAQWLKSSL